LKKNMASKKQVFAATMLAAIAITAIAYAHLLAGAITITPQQVVTTYDKSVTFPKGGGVFTRTADKVILLDFRQGGFAKDDLVLVKIELLADQKAYALRSLLVEIVVDSSQDVNLGSGSKVAELTLNNPYDEFVVQITGSGAWLYLDAKVTAAAGPHVGGDWSIPIRFSVSITGWA
jgi:hypothetical protein